VPNSASLILTGGNIRTVDSRNAVVEAVALGNSRILAAGSRDEVQALATGETTVIELHGRTVVPGLIDAHTHLEGIAAFHRMLDVHIPPLRDVDEILERVAERAREQGSGTWVVGAGGWGQALPTRAQLDSAAPNNPVVLRESAHVQVLNSAALAIAGITRDSEPPRGGHIFRDADGEPTGVIQEMPAAWQRHVPEPTYDERKRSLREVMEEFRAKGVTTVYDFPSGDGMRMHQEMREAGELPIRLRWQIFVSALLPDFDPAFPDFLFKFGPRTGFGDEWLRLGGVKLFIDGETESAVRYDPPGQRETWIGDVRYTQEELGDLVLRAHRAGFQVWTHALGDKAQDMILEAYERAQREAPRPDPRHRIEHAANQEAGPTTPEQLDRMKRLGVIPVPTPAWIYLGRNAFATQAPVPYIYRTLLDRGFRPPSNSDSLGSMPESTNPFFGMWAMVTRRTRDGDLLAPDEAITPGEALRSYTIDAAYSGFEEHLKGSIEPGKLADLVVLSDDPVTCPPDAIKEIHPEMVVVGGVVAFGE
jgi:predicted amidohydrolase YtcJ